MLYQLNNIRTTPVPNLRQQTSQAITLYADPQQPMQLIGHLQTPNNCTTPMPLCRTPIETCGNHTTHGHTHMHTYAAYEQLHNQLSTAYNILYDTHAHV